MLSHLNFHFTLVVDRPICVVRTAGIRLIGLVVIIVLKILLIISSIILHNLIIGILVGSIKELTQRYIVIWSSLVII